MESPSVPDYLKKAFHRDLELFSGNTDINRALVFPTINSYTRLCLHTLVKDEYPTLTTFSVGGDKERQLIVCHQQAVINHTLLSNEQSTSKINLKQTVPNDGNHENEETGSGFQNEVKSQNARNSEKTKNRKRPDRPVYVPPSYRRKAVGTENILVQKQLNHSETTPSNVVPISTSDPDYRDEIESILGPVKLVSPFNDYLGLESGCVTSDDLNVADLPNVVELYDFPVEYKTDHLEDCLHRNLKLIHYYDLKWVDDTHALAIFSDIETAAKALNISDTFIKFRPFWSASPQSHTKARILKLTNESTSFKPRPDTSTVMAKRLLARALGMPAIAAATRNDLPRRGAARAK